MRIILAATILAGLSACTSVERLRPDVEARTPPSRLEEIAFINTLREAFERSNVENCYRGDDTYFRPDLSQGYQEHSRAQEGIAAAADASACITYDRDPEPAQVRRYLEAGYGLSDIYCQRFFIVARQSALRRRFERNIGTSVDSLVGTVLSLATAGETAIGIVNAAFGAIDSTFQNIDDSFLVAPDLENVRALVHAAQDAYRLETLSEDEMPSSYLGARSAIERYAGICSFNEMRRQVNASIAEQRRQIQTQTDEPGSQQDSEADTDESGQPTEDRSGDRPDAATAPPPTPGRE